MRKQRRRSARGGGIAAQLIGAFGFGTYRILTEFRCSCTGKTRPVRIVTPSRGAAGRYDSYGRVFPVHEHRKTRLVSDLHNEESNLVVKSFKFDEMQ